jgi:hypothetical protein
MYSATTRDLVTRQVGQDQLLHFTGMKAKKFDQRSFLFKYKYFEPHFISHLREKNNRFYYMDLVELCYIKSKLMNTTFYGAAHKS